MREVKVYRKKVNESKLRIYYVTTNGKFYYIDKKTNKKTYLTPRVEKDCLIISLGHSIKGRAKNIMAKAWLGAEPNDVVEHINGDVYDFRVDNLRVVKKSEYIKNTLVKYQKDRSKRLKEKENDYY